MDENFKKNIIANGFFRTLDTVVQGEITITSKCNNSCIFCSTAHYNEEPSLEQIKYQILKAKETNVKQVNFTGGEPTLHPRFFELVYFAKRLNFEIIHLKTNGRRFSRIEYAKQTVKNGINSVLISLHAPNSEINTLLGGSTEGFNETIQGIKNLVSIGVGNSIITLTVITKDNYKLLPEIVKLAENLGVNGHNFAYPYPVPHVLNNFDKIVPAHEEIKTYLHEALEFLDKNNMLGTVDNIPLCFLTMHEKRANFLYFSRLYLDGHLKCPEAEKCDYGNVCEGISRFYIEKRGWEEFSPANVRTENTKSVERYEIDGNSIPLLIEVFNKTKFGGVLFFKNNMAILKKAGCDLLNSLNGKITLTYIKNKFGSSALNFLLSLHKKGLIKFESPYKLVFKGTYYNGLSQYKDYEYEFSQDLNKSYEVFLKEGKIKEIKNI